MLTEPDADFDSYLYSPTPVPALPSAMGTPTSVSTATMLHSNHTSTDNTVTSNSTTADGHSETLINATTDDAVSNQTMQTSNVIKGLIYFLSQESSQPLWNYEDITAKGIYDGC